VIDKLRAGWTPPDDRRQISDRVPRPVANVGQLRHDLPVDLPPTTAPPSAVAAPTPRAPTTQQNFQGKRVHSNRIPFRVSTHERPHTSTTGPCSDIWESNSIVGTKTMDEGIHTEVEPVNRFIAARKTNTLTAECHSTTQHSTRSSTPCLLMHGCLRRWTTGLKIYHHHELRVQ